MINQKRAEGEVSTASNDDKSPIWVICSDESGGAVAAWALRNRPALIPTAAKKTFVPLFMVSLIALWPFRSTGLTTQGP